ncbi:hypothetical protein [Stenotrophomonas sp. NPDC077659]|uniref:hypothetical protein n=1 Tax=Stenotrophomonas sp. NPDC077659 TaxID=3390694 RepID=UPI003D062EB9
MIDFCKPQYITWASMGGSPADAADMPSIASIPLLFRAHVLGSVSARVALDARQLTSASLVAAMKSISNAEGKLARQVQHRALPMEKMQKRAEKLADLRCCLYSETTPLQRAASLETTLRRVRNLQPVGSHGAAMMEHHCSTENAHLRGRGRVAAAFWAGELNQWGRFNEQMHQLVEHERSVVPSGYPSELIVSSILSHLDRSQPQNSGFNPQAKVLVHFKNKLLGPPAPSAQPGRSHLPARMMPRVQLLQVLPRDQGVDLRR